MNNFELDKEAKFLSDTRSPYDLARELLELREKLKRLKEGKRDVKDN